MTAWRHEPGERRPLDSLYAARAAFERARAAGRLEHVPAQLVLLPLEAPAPEVTRAGEEPRALRRARIERARLRRLLRA
jgi:hypothetical protein